MIFHQSSHSQIQVNAIKGPGKVSSRSQVWLNLNNISDTMRSSPSKRPNGTGPQVSHSKTIQCKHRAELRKEIMQLPFCTLTVNKLTIFQARRRRNRIQAQTSSQTADQNTGRWHLFNSTTNRPRQSTDMIQGCHIE